MTSNRKIRKDFNPAKEYSVNVLGCSEEKKKEVQQAFFDAGFTWESSGTVYRYLGAVKYSNMTDAGEITAYCMYGETTENCNMTAKEFLGLVYEPEIEIKGHVHAELMAQYAEDAKSTTKPWELWQVKGDDGAWWPCRASIMWGSSTEYRRKPKTHFVHGVEIPDLRVTSKYSDGYYYLADPTESEFTSRYLFSGDTLDNLWVERGMAYQHTEEGKQAAVLHAKAMLGITATSKGW